MRQSPSLVLLPHALLAELIRRYWVLDIECSVLEVHHLAWLLVRQCRRHQLPDPLDVIFQARRYGPYANVLRKIVIEADDNLLCYDDDSASDAVVVWLSQSRLEDLTARLAVSDALPYREAIEDVDRLIDGFQSPLGMEALATLDWLISQEGVAPTVEAVKAGLRHWPDDLAGQHKLRLFSDRLIALTLERLTGEPLAAGESMEAQR